MAANDLYRRVLALESESADLRESLAGRMATLETEMHALLWLGKSTFVVVVLGVALTVVKGWLHLP